MTSIAYFCSGNYLNNGRSTLLFSGLSDHFKVEAFSLNLKDILRFFKHRNSFTVIFLDNRKATLTGFLMYPWISNKIIIQDVRELYTLKEAKSIINFIGTCFEGIMMRLANIVIVANKWRRTETAKIWGVKCPILVYENIRFLPNNSKNLKSVAFESHSFLRNLLKDDHRTNFVLTSGFSLERDNDRLLEVFSKRQDTTNLFFIGPNTKDDMLFFEKFIRDNEVSNIYHLDPVNIIELRGLLKYMQIGLVIYSKKNLNNRYCASGKAFEFMEAGLPILTSDNIPLLYITRKYNAGITTNNLLHGIDEVIERIAEFRENLNTIDYQNLVFNYKKTFFSEIAEFINNG